MCLLERKMKLEGGLLRRPVVADTRLPFTMAQSRGYFAKAMAARRERI
jgi:hypothetical protein